MADKKKSWGKEGFMTAFYANSGSKHKTWGSFYKAMNAESKKAGAGEITELRLAMRVGSINSQLKKGDMKPWGHPKRPRKEAAKAPSVLDIAKKITGGK